MARGAKARGGLGRGRQRGWLGVGIALTGAALAAVGACTSDSTTDFDGTGAAGASTSTGGAGTGGAANGGGGSSAGGGGTNAGGGGGAAGECSQSSDCNALFGNAPCGSWQCNGQGQCQANAPSCTDADTDGYGSGAGCACAGLDCDDADPTVQDTASGSCYSGPVGTDGVGTCQAGTHSCAAGVWSPCSGEVVPSGEACNALDDDCNGVDDDGLGTFSCGLGACAATVAACSNGVVGVCVPGAAGSVLDGPTCDGIDSNCNGPIDEDCKSCIPVTPNGNDGTGDGTFALPFATVQGAIDWAAGHAGPKTVCVAGGTTCNQTHSYAGAVVMANGVSVLGSYESSNWNRCGNLTTTLAPPTGLGVSFTNAVQTTTVLDGFQIDRFLASTTAAVTVDGATGVILSWLRIQNLPSVTNSYGVDVANGAEAVIARSYVDGGTGTGETIGIRSVGSRITVQNNCATYDANGRCNALCGGNPSIRGRLTAGTGVSYGILLDDSPGSTIQASAICGNSADDGAGIRIAGDGTGITIRGSLVNAWGGLQSSHGVWMEDCNGAAPWLVDNFLIAAAGTTAQTEVDGVRAIGDCHPVVDSNVAISGGAEGGASSPNGVYCGTNGSLASRCVVLGNRLISGSGGGFPPVATGVRCDDGGCMRIANNTITGRGGQVSYGVVLGTTGTLVDGNVIRGGCAPVATGVQANDSAARVQNNRIFAYAQIDCGAGSIVPPQQSRGMQVFPAAGANEIDVHSNDLDGTGNPNAVCTSTGLEIAAGLAPLPSGVGIFRNNIVRGGVCSIRYVVAETGAGADPRVFEHNDLDPFATPTALYRDEGANDLGTAAAVDALADMTVNGTLSADALYVNYPTDLHLGAASPCIGAGTATGAPSYDMDGLPRDLVAPDIGADER
ncbi:MAG: hypothetical protein IT373_11715 [Polyangiaceae bacterium]|nr:hypothetical protein [Polyangiaceae bacterium]